MPLDIKKIQQWVDKCDSTADAARRLGIRRENLVRLLTGDRTNLTISTLEHFADVMGIDARELIRRAICVRRGP